MLLTGSAGVGKTSLAKLLSDSDHEKVLWCSLAGSTEEQLPYILLEIGRLVDANQDSSMIVLDAFDVLPAAARHLEEAFGSLLYTLTQRRVPLVLTSARGLTGRLARFLSFATLKEVKLPPFSIQEIALLAQIHDCSDPALASKWASLVYLQTSGHPQLVHCRVTALRAANWPEVTEKELAATPVDVELERSDAQQILLSDLSEGDLELVYRLSTLMGPCRRDQAIALSELEPAIDQCAARFDKLLGPWVEPAEDDYYRISPLIAGIASRDWSREKLLSFQASAAWAIVHCGRCTLRDASNVLMLALTTQDSKALKSVIVPLLLKPAEDWPTIASWLSWVPFVCKTDGQPFPASPEESVLFRKLQFRVCVEVEPTMASEIAESWERSLSFVSNKEIHDNLSSLFAITICTHATVPVNGAMFIRCLLHLHEHASDLRTLVPFMSTESEAPNFSTDFGVSPSDPESLFLLLSASRCESTDFLEEIMDGIHEAPEKLRKVFLRTFELASPLATLMLGATWLSQAERETPDWDCCLRLFKKIFDYAIGWDCVPLVEASARAKAVIFEEYMNDPEGALKEISQAENSIEIVSYTLRDTRAMILSHIDKKQEALDIWSETIPNWQAPPTGFGAGTAMHSCCMAGTTAMQLGNWGAACQMFMEGHKRANLSGQAEFSAGFLGDAAYANWKAGNAGEAVKKFAQALEILDTLAGTKSEIGPFTVNKLVGATIMWCSHSQVDRVKAEFQKPIAGWCSNPDRDESIMELPFSQIDYSRYFLARLECYSKSSCKWFYDTVREDLENSTDVILRLNTKGLAVEFDLLSCSLEELPKRLYAYFSLVLELRNSRQTTEQQPTRVSTENKVACSEFDLDRLVCSGLLAGIVVSCMNGVALDRLIKSWAATQPELSVTGAFRELIETANRILELPCTETESALRQHKGHIEVGLLACTRICMLNESNPDMTFYAHSLLTDYFSRRFFAPALGVQFAEVITKQWSMIAEVRAILRTPRLTVPEIVDACRGERVGFSKAATILVSIPRQSRGLYCVSRSKRLAGALSRARSLAALSGGC